MKMIDVGRVDEELGTVAPKTEKKKKHYPTVRLPMAVLGGKKVDLKEILSGSFMGRIVRLTAEDWDKGVTVEIQKCGVSVEGNNLKAAVGKTLREGKATS